MPATTEEKRDYTTLTTELRKEFKKGSANREVALNKLSITVYRGWSIMTHAYEIMELVKLSYPTLEEVNHQILRRTIY